MSQLIKLSDGCYVAADQIAEVKTNPHSHVITVRTKDGVGHAHMPGYKQGLYEAQDALIAQINEALSK